MKYEPDQTEATHYSVTELRVHGVGGSTPEELLGVPHVQRVAGTKRAGFYRSPKWISLEGPKRNLEGYSWGGITSSSRLRALWIILLPFALVNLAGWMFPQNGSAHEPAPRTKPDAVVVGLYRLFALTTSLAVTAFGSIVLIELIGLRCVGSTGCADPWYLKPWELVNGNTSRGIVVGGLVAAGMVLTLALVARLGQASKGEIDPSERSDPVTQTTLVGGQRGDALEIWQRPDVAERLGLAHTSASLVVIALMCVEALVVSTERSFRPQLWALAILGALVALQVLALSSAGSHIHRAFLILVVTVFAWTMFTAWFEPATGVISGDVAAVAFATFGAFGVAFAVTAMITLGRRWIDEMRPDLGRLFPRFVGGEVIKPVGWIRFFSPISLLSAAVLLIVAVGAGLLGVAVDALSIDFDVGDANRFAVLGILWFAGAIPAGLIAYFRQTPRPVDEIASQYELEVTTQRDERFVRRIQRAERVAAVTDNLDGILFGGFVGALVGVFQFGSDWVAWLTPWAERTVLILPVIGVSLITWMIRNPSARRGFGVIWDVSTFWPRWFHPWAPPAYGEFAVPHLHMRIEGLVADREAVVLSTHSQGSVIGAAVLAALPADQAAHVRWLTHGCPLDRLYATYFPEFFDAELFGTIGDKLARTDDAEAWRNLWRRTDYIGGRVLADVDRLVVDPESSETPLPIDPRPQPLRHSDFYGTTAYDDALRSFVSAFERGV